MGRADALEQPQRWRQQQQQGVAARDAGNGNEKADDGEGSEAAAREEEEAEEEEKEVKGGRRPGTAEWDAAEAEGRARGDELRAELEAYVGELQVDWIR